MAQSSDNVALPKPSLNGSNSLEQLLAQRRSVRDYSDTSLELAEIGQLLWAAQGITDKEVYRAVPSAGALYPLEVYVAHRGKRCTLSFAASHKATSYVFSSPKSSPRIL